MTQASEEAKFYYLDADAGILNAQRFSDLDQAVTSWMVTPSSLNDHFGDLRSLEARYRAFLITWRHQHPTATTDEERQQSFSYLRPYLLLTRSRMLKRLKRKEDAAPSAFEGWLIEHLDHVRSAKDFEAFLLVFETAYGLMPDKAKSGGPGRRAGGQP